MTDTSEGFRLYYRLAVGRKPVYEKDDKGNDITRRWVSTGTFYDPITKTERENGYWTSVTPKWEPVAYPNGREWKWHLRKTYPNKKNAKSAATYHYGRSRGEQAQWDWKIVPCVVVEQEPVESQGNITD